MYLEDFKNAKNISERSGFTIFVSSFTDDSIKSFLKNFPVKSTFVLYPEESKTSTSATKSISVEAAKSFRDLVHTTDRDHHFFVVVFPESMVSPQATNCLLKTLEEPSEFHHFIFLTKSPSSLLPTIRSRANIFYEKVKNPLSAPVIADEKIKSFAKRLMTAKERELPALAKEISDKKSRTLATDIVATAIELSVKSYFATKNPAFLKKLDNLMILHENLSKNGHLKLHFVADML